MTLACYTYVWYYGARLSQERFIVSYVPLHVHSIDSGSEGMMTVRELVQRAAFHGLGALALTDHRSTFGHFEFFREARRAGIKPVLGAEIQHASLVGAPGVYHLTVLAENEQGYRNLCAVVSRHSARDKEPHVTVEDLERHCAGLIVLTGCLKGEAAQAILHGNLARARDVVMKLVSVFGASNVFLEVMNHNEQEESLVSDQLRILSTKTRIPIVITNNDRFLQKEDAEHYRLARRIGRKRGEEEREASVQEYYLKREKDILPFFNDARDALERSGEIAERCTVDLSRAGRISFSAASNAQEALANMCRRRFTLTFHARPADERSQLKRRVDRELAVAGEERVADFLLFLRELFTTAVQRGIGLELMGGDLLESLVAHLLEITPLNPVDHGLVFESFSTARRGAIPFIELIISEERKERFIEIVKSLLPGYTPYFKVAREEMSLMTIAKETAEALDAPRELRDEISRILSFERRHGSLGALLDGSPAAQRLYSDEPRAKTILHAAYALQGKCHYFTFDTSKLVVAPAELEGLYSVVEGPGGERFAQLSSAAIEEVGGWAVGIQHSHFLSALEMTIKDVQGESALCQALRLFGGPERIRWTPDSLDDPHVFALLSSGDTEGIYLLESQGMRDHLARIKPSAFDELVNVISLYRPGPMEGRLWERYLENADKKGKVYLPHPSLAPVLAGTRGVLLYREQVREILGEAAGLRGSEAIAVERALWSKDSGDLMSARLAFMRGAMDAGLDEEDGQRVFDFLLHNIGFTHSKALSCAQASVSYRTAFLKSHLFERYFTALLNSNIDVKERRARYLEYLKERGVSVYPAGINAETAVYALDAGCIRAPLATVASLEKPEWEAIRAERSRGGDFSSLGDFLERMGSRLPVRAALDLVGAGAFDGSGESREELGEIVRSYYGGASGIGLAAAVESRPATARRKKESPRQTSLFDSGADDRSAKKGGV
jgi:DNA polymerase-3 subunit alpha